MKIKHLILFILSLSISYSYAQKSKTVTNSTPDSLKTTNLDCIQLNIASLPKNNLIPAISLGYSRELRIYKTLNICLNTELKNIRTMRTDYLITDQSNSNGENVFINAIHATFSIEPRWYFSYKNRVLNNKNTSLNSGWFVSGAVNYESGLLNNIYPDFSLYAYSFHVSDAILTGNYISYCPQVGFRYALFQKLIIEANFKYSIQLYSSNEHMLESGNTPYLNLKIGYCL